MLKKIVIASFFLFNLTNPLCASIKDEIINNLIKTNNLSFYFIRQMYDNDTSKSFYTSACSSPYNQQTGCKIRYDIKAIDFAGNISTHDDSNTTDTVLLNSMESVLQHLLLNSKQITAIHMQEKWGIMLPYRYGLTNPFIFHQS